MSCSEFLVQIGIIGGSGLNNPSLFEETSECTVQTPYGDPSDVLREGLINGVPCVLLARLVWEDKYFIAFMSVGVFYHNCTFYC